MRGMAGRVWTLRRWRLGVGPLEGSGRVFFAFSALLFAFSVPQGLPGGMVGTFRVSVTNPGIRTLGRAGLYLTVVGWLLFRWVGVPYWSWGFVGGWTSRRIQVAYSIKSISIAPSPFPTMALWYPTLISPGSGSGPMSKTRGFAKVWGGGPPPPAHQGLFTPAIGRSPARPSTTDSATCRPALS